MQSKRRAPWGGPMAAVFIWGVIGGVALVAMLRLADPGARLELTYARSIKDRAPSSRLKSAAAVYNPAVLVGDRTEQRAG